MDLFSGATTIKIVFAVIRENWYSKKKVFALLGSKFILFNVDPFSEGCEYRRKQIIQI